MVICMLTHIWLLLTFVMSLYLLLIFFFSSRRRHTILQGDWSSDVCSSDLWPVRQRTARDRRWDARLPIDSQSVKGPGRLIRDVEECRARRWWRGVVAAAGTAGVAASATGAGHTAKYRPQEGSRTWWRAVGARLARLVGSQRSVSLLQVDRLVAQHCVPPAGFDAIGVIAEVIDLFGRESAAAAFRFVWLWNRPAGLSGSNGVATDCAAEVKPERRTCLTIFRLPRGPAVPSRRRWRPQFTATCSTSTTSHAPGPVSLRVSEVFVYAPSSRTASTRKPVKCTTWPTRKCLSSRRTAQSAGMTR